GIPANHEDELTLSGAPVTVSDRGVEELYAAFSTVRGDFAGEGGRHGVGIDIDAVALERFHGAVRALENFFERWGIVDDGEEEIASGGDFFGRFGELGSGGEEFASTRGGAVPNRERIAGLE